MLLLLQDTAALQRIKRTLFHTQEARRGYTILVCPMLTKGVRPTHTHTHDQIDLCNYQHKSILENKS